MSAKLYVEDAGAGHKTKKLFVSDSGAVIRKIKKIYASPVTGLADLVYISEDDLSMLVGTAANSNGYAAGGFGTLTPNTLGDGAVVDELIFSNHSAPVPGNAIFAIHSYPGTITSAYLTSLTVGANVLTPSDPTFTGFSGGAPGGSAQWTWSGVGFPTVGSTLPVVVVRA